MTCLLHQALVSGSKWQCQGLWGGSKSIGVVSGNSDSDVRILVEVSRLGGSNRGLGVTSRALGNRQGQVLLK